MEGGRKGSFALPQGNRETEEIASLLDRRQALSARLKEPDAALAASVGESGMRDLGFKTTVRIGGLLRDRVARVAGLRRRDSYQTLRRYLQRGPADRVCVIGGLRRTGKTTMTRQAIADMTDEERARAALIEILPINDYGQLRHDMFRLQDARYTYVFVDEVTLLADFIDNAALFSDVFVVEGMRIVLTGGDSLGFWFASREELYDRCVFIHTTHVPFHEHARLLGTEDIDEYLEYGGTLRMADSGLSDPYSYDGDAEVTFATYEATRRYVDTAIVCNIQNSLSFYQGGRHFRHLRELYVADELTSAIKGVIEDVNHGFVADVLRCRLSSHDLGSARQLASRARDPERRTDVLDHIDTEAVTAQLMECSTYWTRTGKRSPSQTPMPRRYESTWRHSTFWRTSRPRRRRADRSTASFSRNPVCATRRRRPSCKPLWQARRLRLQTGD